MDTRPLTHDDYAEEAESAERAEAWPQALALDAAEWALRTRPPWSRA